MTLDELKEDFGGIEGLAKALNITRQAIDQWKGKVPRGRAFEIQHITNGRITAEQLLDATSESARTDAA